MSTTCTKEFTIEESTCAFNSDFTQPSFARTAAFFFNYSYSPNDCYLLVDQLNKYDSATNALVLKATHFTWLIKGVYNPITGYSYYSDSSGNLVIFDPATEAIVAVTPLGATVNSSGFKQMQYVSDRSLIYMYDENRNFGYIDTSIPAFIPLASFPARSFYSFEYSPIANAFYISWIDGASYGIAKFDLDTNTYSEIYTGVISTTAIVWDSLRNLMLMLDNDRVIEFDTASDTISNIIAVATLGAGAYQASFVPSLNKVFFIKINVYPQSIFGYHVSGHTLTSAFSDHNYVSLDHINDKNFLARSNNAPLLTESYYRLISVT